MRHLSSDEFVDLADGVGSLAARRHLESCAECRRQLSDIQTMTATAAAVDVPEPSPLFWDQLSARVREAVAAESAVRPSLAPGWAGWSRPAWLLSAGAVAAAIVAVLFSGRLIAPDVMRPDALISAPVGGPSRAENGARVGEGNSEFADDPSFEFVADLAAEIDWGSAIREATPTVGSIEEAANQLSDAERRELQRLLEQELTHRGV